MQESSARQTVHLEKDSKTHSLERVYRHEYGQLLATLIGWLGDLELAEEAAQDAFLAAVEHWEREGVPHKPGAWLTTTARRKAIDRLRRSRAQAVEPQALETLPPGQLVLTEDFDDAGEIPDRHHRILNSLWTSSRAFRKFCSNSSVVPPRAFCERNRVERCLRCRSQGPQHVDGLVQGFDTLRKGHDPPGPDAQQ